MGVGGKVGGLGEVNFEGFAYEGLGFGSGGLGCPLDGVGFRFGGGGGGLVFMASGLVFRVWFLGFGFGV